MNNQEYWENRAIVKDKLLEKTEFEYVYDAYGRCESEETYVTYYSGDVSDNGNDNKRFS